MDAKRRTRSPAEQAKRKARYHADTEYRQQVINQSSRWQHANLDKARVYTRRWRAKQRMINDDQSTNDQ